MCLTTHCGGKRWRVVVEFFQEFCYPETGAASGTKCERDKHGFREGTTGVEHSDRAFDTDRASTSQNSKLVSFSRRTVLVLVVLLLISFAFNWYYLLGGFYLEDMAFVSMVRQESPHYERWKGFWAEGDLSAFTGVWWKDEGLRASFWRPIPSLVIEASIRLFGETAFPLHLLLVLLHGCVAFTIYLLFKMLTKRTFVALLSALLFLACEDHSMVVGWISTGTDIICVFFANVSLLAHAAWLQKRRVSFLVGSLISLVIALGSKESAVIIPILIASMSALMPDGRDMEGQIQFTRFSTLYADTRAFLRDWLSWAPAIVILAIYLGIYKGLDPAGMRNLMYVDPFSQPVEYLKHLVLHLPVMWMATTTIVPPSLVMFSPRSLIPLAALGLICFGVWIAALWPLRGRAVVIWAMLVFIIALLPQLAADASERGMYFPYVGASFLLAVPLGSILPLAGRIISHVFPGPLWTRAFGWYVLVGVLIAGALLSALYPYSFAPGFTMLERETMTALPHMEERKPQHTIMLNTSGVMNTFYPPIIIEYHRRQPTDVRILCSCNAIVTIERTGDESFVIRSDRPGWLSNFFARALRVEPVLQQGRVYRNDLFSATLLRLTDDRLDTLAVRFDMHTSLSDDSILFLYWDRRAFRPIDLAALPVGERKQLADTSNVWASLM